MSHSPPPELSSLPPSARRHTIFWVGVRGEGGSGMLLLRMGRMGRVLIAKGVGLRAPAMTCMHSCQQFSGLLPKCCQLS